VNQYKLHEQSLIEKRRKQESYALIADNQVSSSEEDDNDITPQ
jgi:hypothetical protein